MSWYRSASCSARAASLILALATVAGVPARAAQPALDELLHARWFETEIIVFERLDVLDFNAPEVLVDPQRHALPARLMAYHPQAGASIEPPFGVDAATQRCLTYPIRELPAGLSVDDYARLFRAREPQPGSSRGRFGAAPPEADVRDRLLTRDTTPGAVAPPIEPRLEPTPQLQLLDAVARYEQDLHERAFQLLPEPALQLTQQRKLMNRRRNLRILDHRRWLQPVPERSAPVPLLLHVGALLRKLGPDPVQQVEGSIEITVGRFLHFNARLAYYAYALGARPQPLPAAPTTATTDAAAVPAYGTYPHMGLAESRRMRSGELHYLDHPKLGIVVRIDPVTHPQSLLDALEAPQAVEALREGASAGGQ